MDTNEPAGLSDGCVFSRATADGMWMPTPADISLHSPEGQHPCLESSGAILKRI